MMFQKRTYTYKGMPRAIDIAEMIAQLRSFYKQEGRASSHAEMVTLFECKSKNAVRNLVTVKNLLSFRNMQITSSPVDA